MKHKVQIYLPVKVQTALNKYITEKYYPEARVVTATIVEALSEFLQKKGYLDHYMSGSQGGENEVK